MTELNLAKALQERNAGIAQVTEHNQTFLETSRGIARLICQQKGEATADDVRVECEKRGIRPNHNNAYGAVFRSKEFVPVRMTVSRQVSGHGNRVFVYRLKSEK